jgi:hypothetical protein
MRLRPLPAFPVSVAFLLLRAKSCGPSRWNGRSTHSWNVWAIDRTFLTLFQFMTLDSWSNVVRQVEQDRPASLLGFCAWIIITAFFILNLVVAVICESLIELTSLKEKKNQNRNLKRHQNMIAAQTDQLVEETERIATMQAQMLQNQLLIQRALLQIAEHLTTTDDDNDENDENNNIVDSSARSLGGKAALSRLLSSLEDDEGLHE